MSLTHAGIFGPDFRKRKNNSNYRRLVSQPNELLLFLFIFSFLFSSLCMSSPIAQLAAARTATHNIVRRERDDVQLEQTGVDARCLHHPLPYFYRF